MRSAVAAGQTAAGRLELFGAIDFGAIDGTAKRVGARRVETAKRRMGWERRQPMRAAAPARVHASLAATGLRRAAAPPAQDAERPHALRAGRQGLTAEPERRSRDPIRHMPGRKG